MELSETNWKSNKFTLECAIAKADTLAGYPHLELWDMLIALSYIGAILEKADDMSGAFLEDGEYAAFEEVKKQVILLPLVRDVVAMMTHPTLESRGVELWLSKK